MTRRGCTTGSLRCVRGWRRGGQTTSVFEPVLGTALTVQMRTRGRGSRQIDAAHRELLAAFDRIATVLSVFDPHSELRRWCDGPDDTPDDTPVDSPSGELATLLIEASRWQQWSDGIFNPAVGLVTQRWKEAERMGAVPSEAEMQHLADTVRTPRFVVEGSTIRRTGDCRGLNFNALAKGMAVDVAARHLFDHPVYGPGIGELTVNVGGDLLHLGSGRLRVGVENPLRAYDNEPPLASVEIAGQGMATSGSSRRGVRIAGRWFSHVIDPRTGWPVDRIASASVIAPTAAQADVLATLLGVLPPGEGMAMVERIAADPTTGITGPVCCLVVDGDGEVSTNAAWDAQAV